METSFEDYIKKLAPTVSAGAKPTVFLLTCMDYRYARRIIDVICGFAQNPLTFSAPASPPDVRQGFALPDK